jgi:DNA-binding transcriptional LysR family regulator
METLSNLECFVRAAESKSFSAAARRLGLTPAAVSRNVARLEANMGLRLFQRSTRKLSLTEAGERFLLSVSGGLESVRNALATAGQGNDEPAGILRITMPPGFGSDYVLPLMPEFIVRYPHIQADWHMDNHRVDLISEGFDAAIGGGFDLTPGVVARELARIHVIAVTSPSYLQHHGEPKDPAELDTWDWVAMKSVQQGRLRNRLLRNRSGREARFDKTPRFVFNDPDAVSRALLLGLGVALVAVPQVRAHLDSGRLKRVLPQWHFDDGPISLYFPAQQFLPAKTRAFIDFVVEQFRERRIAELLSATKP